MFTSGILEKNGPIVAAQMRDIGNLHNGKFVVVALHYGLPNSNIHSRYWIHGTPKSAMRSLASICDSRRGKKYRRDVYAAAIVTPCGHVLNYNEMRAYLESVK